LILVIITVLGAFPLFTSFSFHVSYKQGGLSSSYKKFVEEKGLADETYSADGVALVQISGTSSHNNKGMQVDAVCIFSC